MTIGFDAKRLFQNFTGLGNYSRTLINNLSIFFPENSYSLYTPTVIRNKETDIFLSKDNCKTIVPATKNSSYWRSVSIVNDLIDHRIKLYHGLSNEIPLGIYKKGIKSIITVHDLIFRKYPHTYPWLDRKIYDFKFKYAFENADVIIAISHNTKKDIVNIYNIDPSKIKVVYQACDTIFYSSVKEDKKNVFKTYNLPSEYILYVGSIIERKNLLSIIEAYTYLTEPCKIPLIVVGSGKEYKKKVQTYIKNNSLERYIIWLDNLPDKIDLKTLYENAKMLIYPSIYEGFGLPVLEAILCKIPVITSNTSSLIEVGGKDSFFVDPLNAEEIATQIQYILENESQVNQKITSSYNNAMEVFSEKKLTSQIMEIYKQLY